MKSVGAAACFVLTLDAIWRAVGMLPSGVFSPGYAWVFWLFASAWLVNGILLVVRK